MSDVQCRTAGPGPEKFNFEFLHKSTGTGITTQHVVIAQSCSKADCLDHMHTVIKAHVHSEFYRPRAVKW